MQQDPLSFDPRRGGDIASSTLHFMLFEGLTKIMPDGHRGNGLIKNYTISKDRMTYTFHLRDAYWSNGQPVTAYDVECAWKTILDPAFPSPHTNLLYPIVGAREAKIGELPVDKVAIKAKSNYVLTVTLNQPTPYFVETISFCGLSPVNTTLNRRNPNWAENPTPCTYLCNGPYRLKEYKFKDHITLERNPYYHGRDKVHLDEIHISIVTSENTALEMFEKGKLDMLGTNFTTFPLDAIGHFVKCLRKKPIAATTGIYFNTTKFPFTNANIRKAFAYAISRKEITDNVTQLCEVPALRALPPSLSLGSDPLVADDEPSLALNHFAKGLQELGLTRETFPQVTYLYSQNEFNHKLAQLFQESWKKNLGINVHVENAEFMVALNRMINHDYELAHGKWTFQFHDPLNFFERYKYKHDKKNLTGWESEDFITLLDYSSKCKKKKEREAVLARAEELLMKEVPMTPIFHWNATYLINPRLKGVYISPIGFTHLDRAYFE